MNKFFALCLLALASTAASAQTYIKTNALYWAVLFPNVQVETRLGDHFTFQGEVNASLWTIKDRPMMGVQFIAEGRWYPKQSFKGFYVGADFGFDVYQMSKWDHWEHPSHTGGIDVQHGIGWYLGVSLGYQISIGKRWNMDFFAGGGWHLGQYWGKSILPDGSRVMYAPWNASGEWIPYKLGVTFAYRLTSPKRMDKRFGRGNW